MPITVGELKAQLKDVSDDTIVIISKDVEGNEHSPLEEAFIGVYVAESTWSGDVYSMDSDDRDIHIPEGGVTAVVLVPVN